jgi:Peptidase A4 family
MDATGAGRRRWLTALLVALPAAALAIPAASGPASAAGRTTAARTGAAPAAAVVLQAIKGCGKPVTVTSPRRAGAALSGRALGLPDGPGSLMAALTQRHVRWLTTLRCKLHATKPVKVHAGSGGSSYWNWAGYENTTASPDYVQANWQVPGLGSGDGRNEKSSIWPGVGSGGAKGTQLIQAGTEQDISAAGKKTYYLWFETWPAEAQVQITNMVVRPGNKVSVSASYNTTAAGGAVFVICNDSRNVCVSARQASGRPDDHVEWILERTSLCVSHHTIYPPLAPVGPSTFSSSRFDINGDGSPINPISHGKHVRFKMSVGGTLIATTGALSHHGTAFLIVQNSSGNFNTGSAC